MGKVKGKKKVVGRTTTKAEDSPKPQHRHRWGEFKDHGWEDGCYQSCDDCGAIRFKGERYSYLSRCRAKDW